MESRHAVKCVNYVDGSLKYNTITDMDAAVRHMFNFISDSIYCLERYGFNRKRDIVVLIPAIMREHIMEYYKNIMAFVLSMPICTDIVCDGVKCLEASPDGSAHVYYNKLPLIQPEMRSKYIFSHPIF